MDAMKLKYNAAEILAATGMDKKEFDARKSALIRSREITPQKGRSPEYTYDQVKLLCRQPRKPGEPMAEYIGALRQQLKLDGFPVGK